MLRNVRSRRSHISPNFKNTHAVREKLLEEITDLRSKLDSIELSPSQTNLADAQSYKSMIHSRQQLLGDISKQKDERARFSVESPMQ